MMQNHNTLPPKNRVRSPSCGRLFAAVLLLVASFAAAPKVASAKDYEYHPMCVDKLFGFADDGDLPPEGEALCGSQLATIATLTYAANELTGGFSALVAAAIVATWVGIAHSAQETTELCSYEIHPMPYNDEIIEQLLKSQGKTVSPRTVADYYDKVCFRYMGEEAWIGRDSCIFVSGMMFCTITPKWSDQMLCVRIVSGCPCVGNVAGGSMDDPVLKKKDDEFVTDANGNPEIESEDNFHRYFVKHCNMVLDIDSMPLLPNEYEGIIDEICNSWSGYSKVGLTLTSGAVQCLQSTMQNIFQKPLGETADANTGAFVLDPKSQAVLGRFQSDMNSVQQIITAGRALLTDLSKRPLSSSMEFSNIVSRIKDVASGYVFQSEFKGDYSLAVDEIVVNHSNDDLNAAQLNVALTKLDAVYKNIESRSRSFLESVQRAARPTSMTMFQSVQGQFKILSLFMILLYITITGIQIILGSFELSMTNILQSGMQLAIIYYFAMGDAWKEYFYRMIFDASIGVSTLIFEALTDTRSPLDEKCNFSKAYYYSDIKDPCVYPNPSYGGSVQPQLLGKSPRTNQDEYICIKGPFIFRPEYERPYKPVIYHEIDAGGLTTTKVLAMYCTDGNGHTEKARLVMNDVTHQPKMWTCDKQDYTLEEGYRVGELAKMGIDVSKVDPDLGQGDVLLTAMFLPNSEGTVTDLFPPRSSPTARIKEKIIRIKVIRAAEIKRANVNQKYRRYPEIQKYGVQRNFDYVGLFDMVDCKILGYFEYSAKDGFALLEGFDFLGILFGGIIIIILFAMLIFQGLFIAGLVGRMVQSYLVAIIAITILIYFTPIIMPLGLFKPTKDIAADWRDKIISYAFYPAVLFMATGVAFAVMDYAMYGSPETFVSHNMFKPNGSVDGKNCWDNNWSSAPTACLIAKLPKYPNRVSFLGLNFNAGPKPELALKTLFAVLKTIIVIFMLNNIIKQFETAMTEILGLGVDISLEGSVFNDPGQLQNMAKGAVKGLGKAAMRMKDAAKKKKGDDKDEDKDKDKKDGDKKGEGDEEGGESRSGGGGGGEGGEGGGGDSGMPGSGSIPGADGGGEGGMGGEGGGGGAGAAGGAGGAAGAAGGAPVG